MWSCRHCQKEFEFSRTTEKANHSRHCSANPKKNTSYENISKTLIKKFEDSLGIEKKFEVNCDKCLTKFTVIEREKQFPCKKSYFCSRSCANSVGGSKKAELFPSTKYTTIAWKYHEKKCIICGEYNIVAVHHFNEDHGDNRPENLVPLCPTHHQYWHSQYKYLIEEKVITYVNMFILTQSK